MSDERNEAVVRMDAAMWSFVAKMHACKARIQAMKEANDLREHQGFAHAYGEEAFQEEADKLEWLADQMTSRI